MFKCLLFHAWMKWSEPVLTKEGSLAQIRTCRDCGRTQVRWC